MALSRTRIAVPGLDDQQTIYPDSPHWFQAGP